MIDINSLQCVCADPDRVEHSLGPSAAAVARRATLQLHSGCVELLRSPYPGPLPVGRAVDQNQRTGDITVFTLSARACACVCLSVIGMSPQLMSADKIR